MTRRVLLILIAAALTACASYRPHYIHQYNQFTAEFVAGGPKEDYALVVAGILVDRPEGVDKADATVVWRRLEDDTGEFGVFRRNKREEVIARTSNVLFRTLDDRATWSLHWIEPGFYALDGGELSRDSVGARVPAELRDGKRYSFEAKAGEILFIGLSRVPFEPEGTVSLARMSKEDFQDVLDKLKQEAPRVKGEPQPARFILKAVRCVEDYDPLAYHQHCK